MTGVRVNIFKCASVYLCIYLCTKIPPFNKHIPDETWGMNKSKTKRIIQLWRTLETSLVLGEVIQVTKRNDIDCKKSLAYKQITEKSTLRFSDFVPSFFFFRLFWEAIRIIFNFLYNPRIQSKLSRQTCYDLNHDCSD